MSIPIPYPHVYRLVHVNSDGTQSVCVKAFNNGGQYGNVEQLARDGDAEDWLNGAESELRQWIEGL